MSETNHDTMGWRELPPLKFISQIKYMPKNNVNNRMGLPPLKFVMPLKKKIKCSMMSCQTIVTNR